MEHKQKALDQLRQYTADGKSYFEATAQLANEGYSQSDINDATFAFRAGKDKVQANEALANSIVSAQSAMAKDAATNERRSGLHFRYPGGGLPPISNRLDLPLWVEGVGIVMAIIALVYVLR